MHNSTKKRTVLKLIITMSRVGMLTLITLLTFSGVILASGAMSQNLKDVEVAYHVGPTSLKMVLKGLEERTGFNFVYTEEIGNRSGISLSGKATNLYDVLRELSKQALVSFNREHYMIAVVKHEPIVKPKRAGTISGEVLDETGVGLPGASVRILELNTGSQTDGEGKYLLSVAPGVYTLEITFLSYQTQRITGVAVKEGETTILNIGLKPASNVLNEVVITESFERASVEGHYAKQRNSMAMTDGISSQQISATPDRHVGETLKRITGVSTQDNRKVVVRGIAERYNTSLLNGSPLPSTDVQEQYFEFDIIPTNLVESIVVSKSVTADMPYGFAGGMVQITTKSVPTSNFASFSAGTSFNSRTQGEDFLGYQRGKYDYLGFDDGGRDHFPDGLVDLYDKFNPRLPDANNKITAAEVAAQNKRIGGTERLGTRVYEPNPSQNYQLTAGRVFPFKKNADNSFGFVGSLSYRNTQQNNTITSMHRGSWSMTPQYLNDPAYENSGNLFVFTTNLGAMLNAGIKFKNHQINTQNLYTHVYENNFSRLTGRLHEDPTALFPNVREDDRPKFSDLYQNKLLGTSTFGRVKVEWSLARTELKTDEKDATAALLIPFQTASESLTYGYLPGGSTNPDWGTMHRDRFTYREYNYEATANASYGFKIGETSHTVKTGFNYLGKHAWYSWVVLPIVVGDPWGKDYSKIPVNTWGDHMSMENPRTDIFYNPSLFTLNGYEAKSTNVGTFVMLDHRPLNNLRINWGVRGEYFKLDTLKNAASRQPSEYAPLIFKENKDWYFLPSASITYTPIEDVNVRVAYSKTAIRAGLMENSRFTRYNPNYGSMVRSNGVSSTLIDNYDVKVEWFPGAGEIISAGFFYKYFDKPAEYYKKDNLSGGSGYGGYITVSNSDWAKVSGWEFEVRKNLGFIHEGLLENVFLSGNLTLQNSKVRGREAQYKQLPDGSDSIYYSYMKYNRALYGQVPLIYNLGAQYVGKKLGMNVVYNYMGYKTFVTSSSPDLAEFERPRAQIDAQISYRLFKDKLEAKLNVSNITDAPFRFFINDASTYELKPGTEGLMDLEWNDRYRYKDGYSEKYEPMKVNEDGTKTGDRTTFIQYVGRTFSVTLTYHF